MKFKVRLGGPTACSSLIPVTRAFASRKWNKQKNVYSARIGLGYGALGAARFLRCFLECGVSTPLCLSNRARVNSRIMPDWPHAPTHSLDNAGAYMVTAATYRKEPLFRSAKRLTLLCERLLELAPQHGWKLEAWAVFPNHYHFVATTKEKAETLPRWIGHLHTVTAKEINREDGTPGRKVWFQYWDSHLTYLRSYLARLNYVHCNAVKHGLVREPAQYPWCSAGWFERKAERPFYQTVMRIRSDHINVRDDFEVNPGEIQ